MIPGGGGSDRAGLRRGSSSERQGVFSLSIVQALEPHFVAFVLGSQFLGLGVLADFRRRDVPPAAAAGQDPVLFDLGDDHARASLRAGLTQGVFELLLRCDLPGPCTKLAAFAARSS